MSLIAAYSHTHIAGVILLLQLLLCYLIVLLGTFTGSIGINTSTESAAGSSKSASSRSEAADDEKVCLLQTISSSESVTFSSDDFKKDTTVNNYTILH